MTNDSLRGALRELADNVTVPDPHGIAEAAVRTARRRHAHRRLAVPVVAAVTVIAIALGALFIVEGVGTSHPQPAGTKLGPGSLPDRIFPTPTHLHSAESRPMSGASLIYNHGGWVAIDAYTNSARSLFAKRVVQTGLPLPLALSADGTRVAAVENALWNAADPPASSRDQIILVHIPTGQMSTIEPSTRLPFAHVQGGISWSPDGSRLAFVLGERATLEGASSASSLAVLDVESQRLKLIADVNADVAMTPTWSPDGMRLAVADPVSDVGGLKVFDLNGNVVLHAPDLSRVRLSGNDWSPDGRTLALIQDEKSLLFVNSANGKVESSYQMGDGTATWSLRVLGWREGSPVINVSPQEIATVAPNGSQHQLISTDEYGVTELIALARDSLLEGSIRKASPPRGAPTPFKWGSPVMQVIYVIAGIAVIIFLAELIDRRKRVNPSR